MRNREVALDSLLHSWPGGEWWVLGGGNSKRCLEFAPPTKILGKFMIQFEELPFFYLGWWWETKPPTNSEFVNSDGRNLNRLVNGEIQPLDGSKLGSLFAASDWNLRRKVWVEFSSHYVRQRWYIYIYVYIFPEVTTCQRIDWQRSQLWNKRSPLTYQHVKTTTVLGGLYPS